MAWTVFTVLVRLHWIPYKGQEQILGVGFKRSRDIGR